MKQTHYTLSRQAEAEQCIQLLLNKIKHCVRGIVPSKYFRSLVLLGGYGKGEGGIIKTAQGLAPHNNFDLMLVTQKASVLRRKNIERWLSHKLNQLGTELNIGIDISVMGDTQLQKMPTRVIWYDMRFGHRTIDGDDTFISSIQHTVCAIPDWDVRNLMVNRGTLMLINNLCLLQNEPAISTQKLVIKHTMKAIVGYGDAMLYFLGQYHWSYAEKRRRILAHPDISLKFKRLYDDAINFRFNPKYEFYLNQDLKKWQADVTKHLAEVHLYCERARLKCNDLNWDNYLSKAFLALLTEREFSLKEIVRKFLSFTRSKRGQLPKSLSFRAKIAYSSANEDNILPIIYPYLAFNPKVTANPQALIKFFTSHLNQPCDAGLRQVVAAYLTRWGVKFDKSLATVLQQNHITI